MKKIKVQLFTGVLVLSTITFLFTSNQKSLADLYKSGKLNLVPEIVLDDNSLPQDVFFESVSDIVCNARENIYVVDYKANNIKEFDSSGKYLTTIGRKGLGPGEFSWPFYMAITKGRLVVWEQRNMRISTLTLEGEFIKSKKFSIEEGMFRKLRALPNGDIVIEWEKTVIFEPNKPQICTINLYSPDLEYKKTIYSREVRKTKNIRKPRFISVPHAYPPSVCWDVAPDGKIVVGYSDKYEIEIHDSKKGKLSSFTHSYEPIKVKEEDKKIHFSGMGMVASGKDSSGTYTRNIPDYIMKNTKFPKYMPVFKHISVDSEGNILVCTYRENRAEDWKYFDAFDKDGKFIRNVQIVGDISFYGIQWENIVENSFWSYKTGKDDLIRIVKYRISE